MVIHACFLAVLIGTSVGGARDEDRGRPILSDHVLADIERVRVVLVTHDIAQVERFVDTGRLKNQVLAKLAEHGIGHVENAMEPAARLIAHIETVSVPDCDKWVYRVQTSLDRLMTPPNRRDSQVQAQVWQSRPVMELVGGPNVQEAIARAVLKQAEAFVGACKAARLQDQTQMVRHEGIRSPAKAGPQNQSAAGPPFVASGNSSVFHRSDCRWARNISEGNRVGYETREQAVQAGKRPCKTCKP